MNIWARFVASPVCCWKNFWGGTDSGSMRASHIAVKGCSWRTLSAALYWAVPLQEAYLSDLPLHVRL
eukprot:1694518-Amphidinium_carterae.1